MLSKRQSQAGSQKVKTSTTSKNSKSQKSKSEKSKKAKNEEEEEIESSKSSLSQEIRSKSSLKDKIICYILCCCLFNNGKHT